MASKKTVELRKAKEKRQKKLVIGAGALLALVLVIQVPRLMHRGQAPSASADTTTTTTSSDASTGVPAAAPVSSSTSAPAATGVAATGLAVTGVTAAAPAVLTDSDVPVTAAAGQLVIFDRFKGKDPFIQQVSDQPTASTGASTVASSSPPSGGSPTAAAPTTSAPPVVRSVAGLKSSAMGAAATISTDGVSEQIAVGGTFPSKSPTFRLVSVSASSAKIAVDGGSYADGSATITLAKGKPVTLMNTSSGTRYQLVFLSN